MSLPLTAPPMPALVLPGLDLQFCRLPIPPSANKLHRPAVRWARQKQRTYIGRARTEAYAGWIETAGWTLRQQRLRAVTGPVCVAHLICPRSLLRDCDSAEKALLDLLQHCHVIENDRQVKQRAGWWAKGDDEILVWIWSLAGAAPISVPAAKPPPAKVRLGNDAAAAPPAGGVPALAHPAAR